MAYVVLKKGEFLKARGGDPRVFKSIEKARNFVMNLILRSKSLSPADFDYLRNR